jgi:hypothetical protein
VNAELGFDVTDIPVAVLDIPEYLRKMLTFSVELMSLDALFLSLS